MSSLAVLLVITLGGIGGQEAAFPANTVAAVGDNATLRCGHQEMSCSQIRWVKRPDFGQVENISNGDTVNDATKYRLNGSFFCNLIIEDVQMTDSGTFVCTVNGSNSGSADLIVLQAKPSCSSSCDSKSTSEKDMVDFSCKLTYRGGGRPEMIWWNKKTHSEVPNVPPQQLNGSTVSRDFSATAEALGLVPPVCGTRFHSDPIPGKALNVPEVQCKPESCSIASEANDDDLEGEDDDEDGDGVDDGSDFDIDVKLKLKLKIAKKRTRTKIIAGSSTGTGVVVLGIIGGIIYAICNKGGE